MISIHALREEGDVHLQNGYDYRSISIHALREEGDQSRPIRLSGCPYFYPRPPRGGRQQRGQHPPQALRYFYPRPPRGGRPRAVLDLFGESLFLSTPSARRATFAVTAKRRKGNRFLSTPSARRATLIFASIVSKAVYFYPRPPRGGRRA